MLLFPIFLSILTAQKQNLIKYIPKQILYDGESVSVTFIIGLKLLETERAFEESKKNRKRKWMIQYIISSGCNIQSWQLQLYKHFNFKRQRSHFYYYSTHYNLHFNQERPSVPTDVRSDQFISIKKKRSIKNNSWNSGPVQVNGSCSFNCSRVYTEDLVFCVTQLDQLNSALLLTAVNLLVNTSR